MTDSSSRRNIIIIAVVAVAIGAAAIALLLGARGPGRIPAGTRLSVYVTSELMCYREPCG